MLKSKKKSLVVFLLLVLVLTFLGCRNGDFVTEEALDKNFVWESYKNDYYGISYPA